MKPLKSGTPIIMQARYDMDTKEFLVAVQDPHKPSNNGKAIVNESSEVVSMSPMQSKGSQKRMERCIKRALTPNIHYTKRMSDIRSRLLTKLRAKNPTAQTTPCVVKQGRNLPQEDYLKFD